MNLSKNTKTKVAKVAAKKPTAPAAAAKPATKKPAAAKPAVAKKVAPAVSVITHDAIATRAYLIWEQAGRPSGREVEFWSQAEKQLRQK
jgi:hypothetical protein